MNVQAKRIGKHGRTLHTLFLVLHGTLPEGVGRRRMRGVGRR